MDNDIIQLSRTHLVQPRLSHPCPFPLRSPCPGPHPFSLPWGSLSPSSLSPWVPMPVSPSLCHPQDPIVGCPQSGCPCLQPRRPHPWWVSSGWMSLSPMSVPIPSTSSCLRWVFPGWMSPSPVCVPRACPPLSSPLPAEGPGPRSEAPPLPLVPPGGP